MLKKSAVSSVLSRSPFFVSAVASGMLTSSFASCGAAGSKLSVVLKSGNRPTKVSPWYSLAKLRAPQDWTYSAAAAAGAAASAPASASGRKWLRMDISVLRCGVGGRVGAPQRGQHAAQGVIALEEVVVEGGAGMRQHQQEQQPEAVL